MKYKLRGLLVTLILSIGASSCFANDSYTEEPLSSLTSILKTTSACDHLVVAEHYMTHFFNLFSHLTLMDPSEHFVQFQQNLSNLKRIVLLRKFQELCMVVWSMTRNMSPWFTILGKLIMEGGKLSNYQGDRDILVH